MNNTIIDYINWRGDLTFDQDSFNELDALVFSRFSYFYLDEIVTSNITILDAYNLYAKKNNKKILNIMDPIMFKTMANSKRYSNCILSNFISIFDKEKEEQFAAVTIRFGKKNVFASFRGTDDSLTGWKEDLNMAYLDTIPSQNDALLYLKKIKKYKKLYVGGHSKGGNIAVYSSSKLPFSYKRKLVGVYNYDGPGFKIDFINSYDYKSIISKINTYIPTTSIIGKLLNRSEKEIVVKSNNKNIMQHDIYSWCLYGKEFVCEKDIDKESKAIDKTLTTWVNETTYEQRMEFVNTVYDILLTGNPKNIDEAFSCVIRNAGKVIKKYRGIDASVKNAVSYCLKLIVKVATDNVISSFRENKSNKK